ncbi:hypothetical protein DFP72DRAFT_849428 [Ephemerocybe angulata]|uniref:Uncharacterized protein n=1 Tax=Ephemerocybe angulata TaxID=980116 RepID=A0A8H6HWF4_9AGAR|nr:hypothetical protein DFP72DRAFT_849428 [Tulosesus angulatus]
MATTDSSHASTNLDGVPADLAIETETIGPGKMATNSAQVATEVVGDDAVGRLAASIAGTSDSSIEGPIVLILCGLIASGKSRGRLNPCGNGRARSRRGLQAHFPRFRRCNQDDLGDRRQVEYLARQSLAQGHSVCIDRTNFNASQRFYWIKIAREFPGTPVWVIVFDTPYEVCAARLQHRTGHPTITSPELGLSVLSRFASDFEPPQAHEGYDRILYLKPSDHPEPEYRLADISAILQREALASPMRHPRREASRGVITTPPLQTEAGEAKDKVKAGVKDILREVAAIGGEVTVGLRMAITNERPGRQGVDTRIPIEEEAMAVEDILQEPGVAQVHPGLAIVEEGSSHWHAGAMLMQDSRHPNVLGMIYHWAPHAGTAEEEDTRIQNKEDKGLVAEKVHIPECEMMIDAKEANKPAQRNRRTAGYLGYNA